MKKHKHYLVTGGAGFIGSAIVKLLLKKKYKVSVFDDFSRGSNERLSDLNVNIYSGDIRDKKKLEDSFDNIDGIFHLAFINGTKFFYTNPEDVLDVGILGMLNIIDLAKKYNVKEFYLASSSEVYQTPKKLPTDENEEMKIPDPYNPRYSYASAKLINEIIGINYGKAFLKKLVIFRPHNVFGPNMGTEHVIPELIKKILFNDGKVNIQGDGNQTRAYIYIDDFVRAIDVLIESNKNSFETYNIGSSNEISINNLISKINFNLNMDFKIIPGDLPDGSTLRRCPNINKLLSLGYEEEKSLEKGLAETVKWYKSFYFNE